VDAVQLGRLCRTSVPAVRIGTSNLHSPPLPVGFITSGRRSHNDSDETAAGDAGIRAMLRDNLVGLIEPMFSSAGAYPLGAVN